MHLFQIHTIIHDVKVVYTCTPFKHVQGEADCRKKTLVGLVVNVAKGV